MKVDIRYNNRKNAKIWQEVRVRIHDRDLWSGSVTLAHIIHPFLVKFAQEDLRPTMSFYPNNIHEIDADEYQQAEQQAVQRWKEYLDTMIYAFYWIKTDAAFGPYGKEIHKELDQAQKNNPDKERFEVWDPVYKKWATQIREHEEKIKEGTRLFGVYFQSLWT